MHHIYSRNAFGSITEVFTGTRSQCQTYLLNLKRAGRMTHFYIVSTLDHAKALKRYSTEA
jgi:hypothetical protein